MHAIDDKTHAVSIYDSVSSELAVNQPAQEVVWQREAMGSLTALRVGTQDQTLLNPPGDDTRIDWGYAYLVAKTAVSNSAIGGDSELLSSFVQSGTLPGSDDSRQPRATTDDQPVLAVSYDLGHVTAKPISRNVIVAYDEIYSIKFAHHDLQPYWSGTEPPLRRCCRQPRTIIQVWFNVALNSTRA